MRREVIDRGYRINYDRRRTNEKKPALMLKESDRI